MAKKEDKDMISSAAKVKIGTSDKVIRGFGYVFITFYAVCCIVPFLIIIGTSFASESVVRAEGVQIIPSFQKLWHLLETHALCLLNLVWQV